MNGQPADRREIFLRQTHEGKMSLATCVQNLPDPRSTDLPELVYDKHGRYVTWNNDSSQQATASTFAESSIEERCERMADALPLSSSDITKQYHLALRNRIEIPPMLMRRVMLDAVNILRIMLDDANREASRNADRMKRISSRINEIERLNQLFDRHC